VDDCTFWYRASTASNGAFNWHTRIASFKFPGCSGPDFSTSASPVRKTVVAGSNTPYTVNVVPSMASAARQLERVGSAIRRGAPTSIQLQ